jgi:hypothetical protein
MPNPLNSRAAKPHWLILGALATLVGVTLFCFDPNQYSFYPRCIFHQTTGLLCPGCGALRAIHQLLHGHVVTAFRFNPLFIVALPVLLGYGVLCWIRALRAAPIPIGITSKWVWVLTGCVLAFSIWRNLPGAPFAALPQ